MAATKKLTIENDKEYEESAVSPERYSDLDTDSDDEFSA